MAEWVVLELSPRVEGESPEAIVASIRHKLRGAEVFLPVYEATVGFTGERVTLWLLEGYGFVRRDYPDDRLIGLAGTKFVTGVVTKKATVRGKTEAVIAPVGDDAIEKLRTQMVREADQGIDVGDSVLVLTGTYRNLTAEVIEDIPEMDSVQVRIVLRSNRALITLPRGALRLVTKAPQPPWVDAVKAVRSWMHARIPVLRWDKTADALVIAWESYTRVRDTEAALRRAALIYRPLAKPMADVGTFRDRYRVVRDMTRLALRGKELSGYVRLHGRTWDITSLQGRRHELDRVDRWVTRWAGLVEDMESLQHQRLNQTHHVVFDGHNLVCRCAMAPGLRDLHDASGRPTGAIVGALNTLATFKKRYPAATMWMTWDGSSQRRRARFAGYKKSRGTVPKAAFEVEELRSLLPLLGVEQVWHPDEEADDVIATLVRGDLAGEGTVVVSTDRDLLQLVAPGVSVLVPATGAGRERFYIPAVVREEFGVEPHQLPELRALVGDVSDEIPGVERLGLRTAIKLMGAYGSVDALFRSTMVGVTKGMHQNLRAAELRVRDNIGLMTLDTLPDLVRHHVCPDPVKFEAHAATLAIKSKVTSVFFNRQQALKLAV